MNQAPSIAGALSLLGLLTGCFYTEEPPAPPPPMVPAAGGVLTTLQAATVIGEARCNHEARCNGIGPSARYGSWEHCVGVLRDDSHRKFSGCQYGVKDRELRQCVYQIQTQSCGGLTAPIDWFERSVVCRNAALCLQ